MDNTRNSNIIFNNKYNRDFNIIYKIKIYIKLNEQI